MKWLAIDYGLKKIGLAGSDGCLVEPLRVIANSPKTIDWLVQFCHQHQVRTIVVGITKGKMGRKAKRFGEKLAEKVKAEVVYQNEDLTTKEAISKMIEVGKKRKERRQKEDAIAAAIILQNHLECLKTSSLQSRPGF